MLYLENGEVKITEEGMCLDEITELYKSDHQGASKPFFKKCLTFLYWGYKKDGEWQNQFPSVREEKAAEKAGLKLSDIKDNKKLKDVIKIYVDNQTTLTERLYLGIKKDIEELLDLIKSIPYVRKIEIEMMIDIPTFEGSSVTVKYPIKRIVEVDNSKEKDAAIQRVKSLINLEKDLAKDILKEQQMARVRTGRKFDRRDK